MYRLIFVDDEHIVREGIRTQIRWGDNGFGIVGVFENGIQALDYLQSHDVDVVLSDISMPRMDGLALSREIAVHRRRIHVLLLTGYDEFEYAQEALQYGVKEFILKPITANELETVLERTRESLDVEAHEDQELALLQEKLEDSLPLLRERFMYRLVSGQLRAEEVDRRGMSVQWNDHGGAYLVLIGAIPDEWDEVARLSLWEHIRKDVGTGDDVFTNRKEDLVILLQGDSADSLAARARLLGDAVYRAASSINPKPVSVGVGEVVTDRADLPRSYRGARNAVDYAHVMGLPEVLSIDEVRSKERLPPEAILELTRRLTLALKEGGGGESIQILDRVFQLLEERYLPPEEVATYLARLNFRIVDFLLEMNLLPLDLEDRDGLLDPRHPEDLPTARESFRRKVERAEELVRRRREDAARSRVDRAKETIRRRYSDPDFSLQDICNELYMSVSQFSSVFKAGTGQTFVEYLTATRINEAKSLLKTTDKRTYEVAESVGYRDPGYFSHLFKKAAGMTTTEYRKGLDE